MYTRASRVRVTRRGAPLGSASLGAQTRGGAAQPSMPVIIGRNLARVYPRKIYYPWPRRGRALSEITVQTLEVARARESEPALGKRIFLYPAGSLSSSMLSRFARS